MILFWEDPTSINKIHPPQPIVQLLIGWGGCIFIFECAKGIFVHPSEVQYRDPSVYLLNKSIIHLELYDCVKMSTVFIH